MPVLRTPHTPSPLRRQNGLSSLRSNIRRPDGTLQVYGPIATNNRLITKSDRQLGYNRRARGHKQCLLHYSNEAVGMVKWPYPTRSVEEGALRVTPDELPAYRQTHDFLYPSCLCCVDSPDPLAYCETTLIQPTRGRLASQWVFACPNFLCKFWIRIEGYYIAPTQLIRYYARRDAESGRPADVPYTGPEDFETTLSTPSRTLTFTAPSPSSSVTSPSSPSEHVRRAIRPRASTQAASNRTARRAAARINTSIVPTNSPEPLPNPLSAFTTLMQLDADRNAGITEAAFCNLFVKCSVCKIYTTKSAFENHICRPRHVGSSDIIDLTINDSD
ncbi:hypothetical protein GGX14DRAFT_560554 [Mycena pura]|uniref:Uncharacterized protein n=1 Tax=Mycena pura TaxID=153505 RepID=A0AAD6YJN6_9AGAR|nr:hypothetical protein GGX14DRAFT_560554 [Mycena pura]